jgi:mannose-1-phosphate guanylyltransferase/mannose-1-phosphate guanylyltransferase/mannose-6-phosphate isomerase
MTLFQEALVRCREAGFGKPMVVTGAAHLELVREQIGRFDVREIVVEPAPRHTAAALAAAALRLPPAAVLLACPSDHHIGDARGFARACVAAANLAGKGSLVCLAVPATNAETRFGYILAGEPLGPAEFRVAQFVEKPDLAAAEAYVSSGRFAWNAGIFAFGAGDYFAELQNHRPALASAVRESVARGRTDGIHFYPDAAWFEEIEPESIDRAVMESTDRSAMVLTDMDWSDVGEWNAVKRMLPQDESGNSVRGPAEIVDCRNILIDSDGPKIHAVGLKDLIIVVDGDDILVASAGSADEIAKFSTPDNR